MSFELLKVRPEIVRALKEHGIVTPTQIQEKTIPAILSGKDVIGISKTGSGKTAAFGIPIIERVSPGSGVQALIVVPTRELVVQIAKELHTFARYMHCSIATVYGGVGLGPQVSQISKSEIVVGTPGRLLDHLERNSLKLSAIKCVVLDEADKMVDMGFIQDIKRIMDQTPNARQVLLFGATISEEVNVIKQRYMKSPVTMQAERQVKTEYLKQYYYEVQQHEKFSLLVHLLKKEETGRTIIFCSTRSTVELVAKNLRANGIKAEMIHGNLDQNKRLRVIENFHNSDSGILVASAVAARGINIKDVTHVFNYDLSRDPEEYIHRIGRTARAGESGKAITLLSQKDHDAFRSILSRFDVQVEKVVPESYPRLHFEVLQRRGPYGGSSYGRNSGNRRGYGGRSHEGRVSHGSRESYGSDSAHRGPRRFHSSGRPRFSSR